jgi:cysteinyl-tRNA synthetase
LHGKPLPIVGRARVYACGITPYDTTHLGHAATFVWVDTTVRVLRSLGVEVEVCRNVTDVDDDMLAAADRAGTPYDQLAALQQFRFDRDMAALGVRAPDHEPRIHRHVEAVVRLAAQLIARGRAYESGGSVYFHGADVPARVGLSRAEAEGRGGAHGYRANDANKADPLDAVLWQRAAEGEPAWPSPWGPGRPGWHAGCTAMAMTVFGSSVDLHAGGADLRFPHHAYEAAQAEALTEVTPFARAWMHVGTVGVGGAKMAKSAGNLVLVSDLLQDHRPAALRMLLLDRRWDTAWDYSEEQIAAADLRVEDLHSAAGRPDGGTAEDEVIAALLDDLDVPRALDIAIEAGGAAARTAVRLLGLPS